MEKKIHWLSDTAPTFPSISEALTEPNGLLAAGGNLEESTLLQAYRKGIFPWFNDGEPIMWWSPDPRMVIKPENVKISKSLAKTLKKDNFDITFDKGFNQVITMCSKPRAYTDQTWITEDMIHAYSTLHACGHAHSIEVWDQGELVGGLYGVAIGRVFFGESMFSTKDNTSKIAFAWLCRHLQKWNFVLVDCQVYSPHLKSLGADTIQRKQFARILERYCSQTASSANWKTERQWNDLIL